MEKVRLTVEIEPELKYRYKVQCTVEGVDMNEDISNYIKSKIKKYAK